MRTSLLLKREPFGEILSETLKGYWYSKTGVNHQVCWFDKKITKRIFEKNSWQVWYGNIYLNFFSIASTPEKYFNNLYGEYGTSKSIWTRWPQKIYVKFALSKKFRNFLSQVAFGVRPFLEDASESFILSGNRRIRLMYPAKRINVVILKKGHSLSYLKNELEFRNKRELNFIPAITKTDELSYWYEEACIDGVPLNRVSKNISRKIASLAESTLLKNIVEPTLSTTNFRDYVDKLIKDIELIISSKIKNVEVINLVRNFLVCIRLKVKKLSTITTEVPISMTHGDFQLANILYCGEMKFFIIDWENVALRHSAYDAMIFKFGCRERVDWPAYVKYILENDSSLSIRLWPGFSDTSERSISILTFLLEEAVFVLKENYESTFMGITNVVISKIRQLEKVLMFLDV